MRQVPQRVTCRLDQRFTGSASFPFRTLNTPESCTRSEPPTLLGFPAEETGTDVESVYEVDSAYYHLGLGFQVRPTELDILKLVRLEQNFDTSQCSRTSPDITLLLHNNN